MKFTVDVSSGTKDVRVADDIMFVASLVTNFQMWLFHYCISDVRTNRPDCDLIERGYHFMVKVLSGNLHAL